VPEYLAPGVYVEETSFRSKSIEGVSTSTTAFVGPARKGPVTSADTSPTPELITSYIDFERVFGGFEALEFTDTTDARARQNHLAFGVSAFFENGGGRLYVARVAGAGATAAASSTVAGSATFGARAVGDAGNGSVVLLLSFSRLLQQTWDAAPAGTVARIGDTAAPTSARLVGTPVPRFTASDGGTVVITRNGSDTTFTFRGQPASVTLTPSFPNTPGEIATVVIDGVTQRISLDGAADATELAVELNGKLAEAHASAPDAATLVISTDSRGIAANISVTSAELGAAAAVVDSNVADADNNVKNLRSLDLDDLSGVFGATYQVDVTAAGALSLSTTTPGADVLAVTQGTTRATLGLATTTATPGAAGTAPTYQVKATATQGFPGGDDVSLVRLAITAIDKDGHAQFFDDLGLDPLHPRFVGSVLPAKPGRKTEELENLIQFVTSGTVDGATWAAEIATGSAPYERVGSDGVNRVERRLPLTGGGDGSVPTETAYRTALGVLERLDDVSIVAAPGYSAYGASADAIEGVLRSHAEKRRSYRIAVLDARPDQSIGEVRQTKAAIDSKYAALYYPWIVVPNPLWRAGDARTPREITVPPSASVCGIYARNDVERGVFKAPANEVVRGALRFESDVNFAEQEVLNPLGVNCLRFFPGRGYRVWGARTTSSDPEWKYVSVRRYFNYLERSIDVGTQWAVFEPNGERLWANVRETIESFLYNEWRSGAMLGTDPKQAFFVRCDRSTMDQNDLDNGRLVCLIGVAVVKPAEFVIFRIGQKTADARN
jgi:uncharacterized protein